MKNWRTSPNKWCIFPNFILFFMNFLNSRFILYVNHNGFWTRSTLSTFCTWSHGILAISSLGKGPGSLFSALSQILMHHGPLIFITFPPHQLKKSKVEIPFIWVYDSQWKWAAFLDFLEITLHFYCKHNAFDVHFGIFRKTSERHHKRQYL